MLNAEKHKDEIVQRNYSFAVTESGKVRNCEVGICCIIGCIFRGSKNCPRSRAEWMLSDALPQTREQIIATLDEIKGYFSVIEETGEVIECRKQRHQCEHCTFNNKNGSCRECRYDWLRENGFIK